MSPIGIIGRSVAVLCLPVLVSIGFAANAYEFGCLVPEWRDGSFFVRGAWEVIDGDTVKIGGYTVDLISIDSPEIGQRCLSKTNLEFDCGQLVKEALSAKFHAAGPIATCLVHFLKKETNEGEGFCGVFKNDPSLHVDCIEQDYGGELARDGYARTTAVGEFPTSNLYWAGYEAAKQGRGILGGQILPLLPQKKTP